MTDTLKIDACEFLKIGPLAAAFDLEFDIDYQVDEADKSDGYGRYLGDEVHVISIDLIFSYGDKHVEMPLDLTDDLYDYCRKAVEDYVDAGNVAI